MQELEDILAPFLPLIATVQDGYNAANGRYAQGLVTHSELPSPNSALAPDRLTNKPTDQAEDWATLIGDAVLPAEWRLTLTVNVYDGPSGKGYTVVADCIHEGAHRRRVVNVGPETHREQDWHVPVAE